MVWLLIIQKMYIWYFTKEKLLKMHFLSLSIDTTRYTSMMKVLSVFKLFYRRSMEIQTCTCHWMILRLQPKKIFGREAHGVESTLTSLLSLLKMIMKAWLVSIIWVYWVQAVLYILLFTPQNDKQLMVIKLSITKLQLSCHKIKFLEEFFVTHKNTYCINSLFSSCLVLMILLLFFLLLTDNLPFQWWKIASHMYKNQVFKLVLFIMHMKYLSIWVKMLASPPELTMSMWHQLIPMTWMNQAWVTLLI